MALPPKIQRLWREADKLPPYSAQIKKGRLYLHSTACSHCVHTDKYILLLPPPTKGVKSVSLLREMLQEGISFHASDMRGLEIWNWKKQISEWTLPIFILSYFPRRLYFFKTQPTALNVSTEFWKLNLPNKTYHGGKHNFICYCYFNRSLEQVLRYLLYVLV